MSLIIALGSNIGDSRSNLTNAIKLLSNAFNSPVASSSVYTSSAVGVTDQPDFFNMVIEFKRPELDVEEILQICLKIELEMGRIRLKRWGPRLIDIDVLYYGLETYRSESLEIPHPRIMERSFVVKPLQELPYYKVLSQHFEFPTQFEIDATITDK
ncbi:MAG: 2-amino-4-hydroxy-6-hydroxymethyldihydropteridine diphosphokinase [Bacteriovorax sp. MedPE-SWde]|nr:MAG: 2-amino-4-hydroxy-6-hydroxymethyldihydropteridine diphosphokinase [Bacteriovorax sp. MedPE-SWde]